MPGDDIVAARGRLYDEQMQRARLKIQLLEGQAKDALPLLQQPSVRAAEMVVASVKLAAGSEGVRLLGENTTGLSAEVQLKMEQLPTAIYHLLDTASHPLVRCIVKNHGASERRIRVIVFIEGYSASAVESYELRSGESYEFRNLQPTLFLERIAAVTEVTRAMVNVLIEDLDGKIEYHATLPLWLLARNTATLNVRDPSTGEIADMSRYLGAFVTPNAPSVMAFLRKVAERHPSKSLASNFDDVLVQVNAIFDALKHDAGIVYVNSINTFDISDSIGSQRVRLPRESLRERQANCLDGVLLFASILEAISISSAIALMPMHAVVGWQDQHGTWSYLDTTLLSSSTFIEAYDHGATLFSPYVLNPDAGGYRRWTLRDLRATYGIYPLE